MITKYLILLVSKFGDSVNSFWLLHNFVWYFERKYLKNIFEAVKLIKRIISCIAYLILYKGMKKKLSLLKILKTYFSLKGLLLAFLKNGKVKIFYQ